MKKKPILLEDLTTELCKTDLGKRLKKALVGGLVADILQRSSRTLPYYDAERKIVEANIAKDEDATTMLRELTGKTIPFSAYGDLSLVYDPVSKTYTANLSSFSESNF